MELNAIIIAAGKGTRMKSKYPKVLHKVLNKPMILHVIDNLNNAGIKNIISIVGYEGEQVKEVVQDKTKCVFQNEQLGTGHAIMMAEKPLKNKKGTTIVICGDTPLISANTLKKLLKHHHDNKNQATILTGVLDDALSYGRVIRDSENNVTGIIEKKDASEEQLTITEFNTGTYVFDNKILFQLLPSLKNYNAQKEYYLTDIIALMAQDNYKVDGYILEDLDESIGVNDRKTLSQVEKIIQLKVNDQHMDNGVTIIDPYSTYIGLDTKIGQDTIVYPNTKIENSTIGIDNNIGPNTEIVNSKILDNNVLTNVHIYDSTIKNNTKLGPYARFRENCIIDDEVRVGNFVEFKNTKFSKGSKAAHLSYIGDATVGTDVNFGCGAITVNYDGKKKHQTKIGNNVFIGCNANLIAPVKIDNNSFVAAGSTITDDVPKNTLSIARTKQTNKKNYYKK
jgi:bifunctional UDP-N-acetylglucosamine pyrophosphorylase / glucosamine-1-phosphate N-acetyltransferase